MFELITRLDSREELFTTLKEQQQKQESIFDLCNKNLTRQRTDRAKTA